MYAYRPLLNPPEPPGWREGCRRRLAWRLPGRGVGFRSLRDRQLSRAGVPGSGQEKRLGLLLLRPEEGSPHVSRLAENFGAILRRVGGASAGRGAGIRRRHFVFSDRQKHNRSVDMDIQILHVRVSVKYEFSS